MKTALVLVVVVATLGFAQASPKPLFGLVSGTQKAVTGGLDLKMMRMEDDSSKEKCYCPCNLNTLPVLTELDSSNLSGTYAVV